MKKRFLTLAVLICVISSLFPFGMQVFAGPAPAPAPESVQLENPLGDKTDPNVIIGTIIAGALSIVGALVLLMFVWGGFKWLTSAGSPEKVKTGTQTMIWAAIGAVIVFASYIILQNVLKALGAVV